ncbi:MAG: DUF1549 domain-containing protein [Pirellulales bacterium]|nr:DUF1549 domain-containing protein [Pirellulales bacterium]
MRSIVTIVVCWALCCPVLGADDAGRLPEHIARILERSCLDCHSGDSPKGGLSLATAKTALAGGESGPAIVPAKPDESLLLDYVGGEEPAMPKGRDPLSAEEIALLRRWIAEGAVWPDGRTLKSSRRADKAWWSLKPLAPVEPPAPDGLPDAWSQNPVDRFIYRKLMEKGLQPSPPADKRTLIRRAAFDLVGLPPTPEEIDAFLADDSPDAYDKLLDRLLASPHYGERWGRHWLDVIRFGESSGYERNHIRDDAWPLRDYVVRSFNEDKPFDRLVLEHLAGDQIAPGDPAVEVGTGFLVAGSYDDVGNQDPAAQAQIRANTLDDTISATGAALLGLTVNCARCHDHKFDPIQQADYYRLQAAFAGVQQGSRVLASAEQKRESAEKRRPIEEDLAAVRKELAEFHARVQPRLDQRRAEFLKRFTRPKVDPHGTEETFAPVEAKSVRFTVHRTAVPGGGAGVVLDEFEVWTAGPESRNVALESLGAKAAARASRTSDGDPTFYGPQHTIDGSFGKKWFSAEAGGQLTIELPAAAGIQRVFWSNDRLKEFGGHAFSEEYDVEVSLDGSQWTKVADDSGRMPSTDQRLEQLLFDDCLAPEQRTACAQLEARERSLNSRLQALPPLPQAWIGRFEQPKEAAYLMQGGDPQKRGPNVAPGSLITLSDVVPPYELALDAPESERRLALARWIVSRENPLAPRVLANRLWHYHFGRGIVATPSDFGFNGSPPTHPELLDWLARQLHAGGWRLKPLHKLIMTSMAYRQAGRYDARNAGTDADSIYLWRFPPRRLEAEAIRDSVLAIAGKLDLSMGGPGFRLYRYTVDNVATYTPLDHAGPETYRRAIYHQNPRSLKVDLLGQFDCPDCSLPAPRREVTVSPLQAMVLENHALLIDMARSFAERLVADAGPDGRNQVRRAFLLAFGREPEERESEAALELIGNHGLMVFCRALYNANEFIYVH